MALALPVLRMERFCGVMSTAAARSFSRILRCARTTSRLTMMGILKGRMNDEGRIMKRDPARSLFYFIIHHSNGEFLFLLNLPAFVHDPRKENNEEANKNWRGAQVHVT